MLCQRVTSINQIVQPNNPSSLDQQVKTVPLLMSLESLLGFFWKYFHHTLYYIETFLTRNYYESQRRIFQMQSFRVGVLSVYFIIWRIYCKIPSSLSNFLNHINIQYFRSANFEIGLSIWRWLKKQTIYCL